MLLTFFHILRGYQNMFESRETTLARVRRAAGALQFSYFAVTARVAEPPKLLRAVMFCGLTDQLSSALYLPPPLFVSVPMT